MTTINLDALVEPDRVPQRVYGVLAALFEELAEAGRLRVDDPRLAAQHFAWLVLGTPLDRGMFMPPAEAGGGMAKPKRLGHCWQDRGIDEAADADGGSHRQHTADCGLHGVSHGQL